jgi:hypothetical protein
MPKTQPPRLPPCPDCKSTRGHKASCPQITNPVGPKAGDDLDGNAKGLVQLRRGKTKGPDRDVLIPSDLPRIVSDDKIGLVNAKGPRMQLPAKPTTLDGTTAEKAWEGVQGPRRRLRQEGPAMG